MIKKKIGAGIFAIDKHTGKILLCKRGLDGSYPESWATFGGTFEERDVTPKETAKREFKEEGIVGKPFTMDGASLREYTGNLPFKNTIEARQ